MRLFCFPHAGVGPSVFRGWADDLDADTEVCLVQLPGRESRLHEPLFSSIAELVPPLTDGIKGLLDRPFAFYGHSLGATIAFEVARRLRRTLGIIPDHLFVAASPAPQVPWSHPPVRFLREGEFLREIQRRYGGVPSEVMDSAEVRDIFVPILRADVTMVETYVCLLDAPLDCQITAFGGTDDLMVSQSSLEAWQQQTSSQFSLHKLQGNHLFLRSARNTLLELIGSGLKSFRKRTGSGPSDDAGGYPGPAFL
jgi:medium-chain acyl-[acyl-carrier-protein] hydrolase